MMCLHFTFPSLTKDVYAGSRKVPEEKKFFFFQNGTKDVLGGARAKLHHC